ncbi:MAG: hypothetical protein ACRYFK_08295 [Janthinobacterium lividum]
MSLFKALITSIFPGKVAPAPPPPPNLLAVEGELIDLNRLSPAQLTALETRLVTQRQQREADLANYLHQLAAERHRLLADQDPALWPLTLKLLFGEDLGRRVAAQDIGPGMQLQHLVLGLGQPDLVEATPQGVLLVYGNHQAGSYFEVQGDTITRAAALAPPALPALGSAT